MHQTNAMSRVYIIYNKKDKEPQAHNDKTAEIDTMELKRRTHASNILSCRKY